VKVTQSPPLSGRLSGDGFPYEDGETVHPVRAQRPVERSPKGTTRLTFSAVAYRIWTHERLTT